MSKENDEELEKIRLNTNYFADEQLSGKSLSDAEKAAHIKGAYDQKIALINRNTYLETTHLKNKMLFKTARIGARARYFHGVAALIASLGVFGAFAVKLYQDNRETKKKIAEQEAERRKEMSKLNERLDRALQAYETAFTRYPAGLFENQSSKNLKPEVAEAKKILDEMSEQQGRKLQ